MLDVSTICVSLHYTLFLTIISQFRILCALYFAFRKHWTHMFSHKDGILLAIFLIVVCISSFLSPPLSLSKWSLIDCEQMFCLAIGVSFYVQIFSYSLLSNGIILIGTNWRAISSTIWFSLTNIHTQDIARHARYLVAFSNIIMLFNLKQIPEHLFLICLHYDRNMLKHALLHRFARQ